MTKGDINLYIFHVDMCEPKSIIGLSINSFKSSIDLEIILVCNNGYHDVLPSSILNLGHEKNF